MKEIWNAAPARTVAVTTAATTLNVFIRTLVQPVHLACNRLPARACLCHAELGIASASTVLVVLDGDRRATAPRYWSGHRRLHLRKHDGRLST